jgi:hypothetical protein
LNAEAGRELRAAELIVMQARVTYLVDATLDATFMKNIVDTSVPSKSVTAQWIGTATCVRPTDTRHHHGMHEAAS